MTTWPPSVNPLPVTQSIFPRIVQISRLKTVAGTTDAIGGVGYSGAEQNTGPQGEIVLFTGLMASIQLTAAGRTTKSIYLPGDATTRQTWAIFIPNMAIYTIRDRDLVYDDEGYRYEVGANYWTPFGYQLSTVREEA